MNRGWLATNLGNVLTLQRGYDLPTSQRSVLGKIPVISTAGISGFHDVYKAEPPGVVIRRYGSLGSIFYITEPFWPLNTTLYVKDFKGNDPLFIYYLLQSINFDRFSDKTGIPGVNRNDIHRLPVLLPPLVEQHCIADMLSTWDRAIDLITQLIVAKQQYKRGLAQQLLTGKRRFTQFSEPWSMVKIGDFLSESRMEGSNGRTARKITVRLYGKGVQPKEEKSLGSTATRYYQRRAGQFIYSKLDFLNGAFGIIPPEMDGYESTLDLPCFDFQSSVFSRFFLYFVSREQFYSRFAGAAIGGRKARRIQVEEFLSTEIEMPDLDEQKRIAEVLDACSNELALFSCKLELLKKQKRGLMQQLLTGKVRVKI